MADADSDSSEDYYYSKRAGRPAKNFNPSPHLVNIVKSETGFGFNVKGQVSEGGQLRSINGELYAPLQHVSAVLNGGAAEQAGLLKGDRILEVNGINVEGATHRTVVELIKEGGDRLSLVVISVDVEEIDRDRGDVTSYSEQDNTPYYKYDYSDKRSLPITIPSYQNVNLVEKKLNKLLKDEFPDFAFPKLPKKWPFRLSEQQLDSRRRMLEQYLEKVCAVKVIADSDVVQEFLMEDSNAYCPTMDVTLKILLHDGKTLVLDVKRNSDAREVYNRVVEKLNLSTEAARYCSLFEMVDSNFERKLHDGECPHNIYIQNYSSAATSCITLKRWCFDVEMEKVLCERDKLFQRICFYQAVNDVDSEIISAKERLYQLKALQSEDRCEQYLQLARQLDGYPIRVVFPQCAFETDEEKGLVTLFAEFNFIHLKLQKEDSQKEKSISVKWSCVLEYGISAEEQTFVMIFGKENDAGVKRAMRICTSFPEYMCEVFDRIKLEHADIEEASKDV
uniref:Uncharacterized protein n=1 Tax=Ditylenchus dipsaci TaxID=166011 RepID=A0A915D631_9BILA